MAEPIKPRPPGAPSATAPQGQEGRAQPATNVQRSVEALLARYNEHFGADRARVIATPTGFAIQGAHDLAVADVQDAIRDSGDSRFTGRVTRGDDGAFYVRLLRREGANQIHPAPEGEVGRWKSLVRRPYELPRPEASRPLMVEAAPFGPHAALPPKA